MPMRTRTSDRYGLTLPSRLTSEACALLSHTPLAAPPRRYNVTTGRAPKRRFLWYRVPKVGSQSIFGSLREAGVEFEIDHAFEVALPPWSYRDHLAFAFVRNPLDRLLSCYQDKAIRNAGDSFLARKLAGTGVALDSFEEFVDWLWEQRDHLSSANEHVRPQADLIDLSRVDFIGRFETFSADLASLLTTLGIAGVDVPHRNRSGRSGDGDVAPDVRAKIAEMYRRDFAILGYDPDSIE